MKPIGRPRRWYAALALTVAASAAVIPAAAQEDPAVPKIIGGSEVDPPGEYPFMVAVVDAQTADAWRGQFCGGSLIAPTWVLTAAHCVVIESPSSIDVVIGRHDLGGSDGERIGVDRIIVHPDYSDRKITNDVAVLELETASSYAPIALPADTALDAPGTPATVTGWGRSDGPDTWPYELREVVVPIVSDADCSAAYGNEFVASSMICAGDLVDGGEDSCQGDSGGPMFAATDDAWTQIGIVSWGDECASATHPGVYSRVSALQPWITEVTGVEPTGGGVTGPSCEGVPATHVGTPGNDVLVGTEGRDVIVGKGGNDEIDGLGGDDLICAGSGDDVVRGGEGADEIYGGKGSDDLAGGPGDDLLVGSGHADVLDGGPGDDRLYSGAGPDTADGGDGHDRIFGGGGDDELYGSAGRDTIKGGKGDDAVDGGGGHDTLAGNAGSDLLDGSWGTDTGNGGPGIDTCYTEVQAGCE